MNLTYEDAFPTPNLEAMACGTPVITYRAGGSPEALSRKTGIVIPAGDLEQAYGAILEIAARGKERYAKACIRQARKYDRDLRFGEYLSRVYRL